MLEAYAGAADFIGSGSHDWHYEGEGPRFQTPPEVEAIVGILHAQAVIDDPHILVRARGAPLLRGMGVR